MFFIKILLFLVTVIVIVSATFKATTFFELRSEAVFVVGVVVGSLLMSSYDWFLNYINQRG